MASGVTGKNLCKIAIFIAKYHVLANMGKGVTYEIYKGSYLKRPAFVIKENEKPRFRIDAETLDVYDKNAKRTHVNLDKGYDFYRAQPVVASPFAKQNYDVWNKYGLVLPNEVKEVEIFEGPEEGSIFSAQGPRPTMEDDHVVAKYGDVMMYGVFDGHGGSEISKRVADNLPNYLLPSLSTKGRVEEIIMKNFVKFDKELYSSYKGSDGSTAIVALTKGNTIYLANLGDSRGMVICYETGKIEIVTKDHKPDNPLEKERARKTDYPIYYGRVGGILAVSRAFGDRDLKHIDGEYGGLEAAVSPAPDVYRFVKKPGETYVIVLACDGLWDVMTNEQVRDWIIDYGVTSNNPSQELVEMALEKGSRDNVSVMTVDLLERASNPMNINPVSNRDKKIKLMRLEGETSIGKTRMFSLRAGKGISLDTFKMLASEFVSWSGVKIRGNECTNAYSQLKDGSKVAVFSGDDNTRDKWNQFKVSKLG